MKNLLKFCALIVLTIVVYSCQSNDLEEVVEIESTEISSRQSVMDDSSGNQNTDPVEISIEFRDSITEEMKNEVREYALNQGYILSWQQCSSQPNIDIWASVCQDCLVEVEEEEDIIKDLHFSVICN